MNTQQILTVAHVVISLLGIAAGFVAMAGMLSGNPANRSTGSSY